MSQQPMNPEMSSEKETVEKKLTDLINMGWTLLEEKCPLESCDCPLLKSLDGNKYCVKCEMWQFPDKERTKQKYTDLVLKAHQELILKETGVSSVCKKQINLRIFGKENVLNALRAKLVYLSGILNEVSDQCKTKQILENIELCVKNIKLINENL